LGGAFAGFAGLAGLAFGALCACDSLGGRDSLCGRALSVWFVGLLFSVRSLVAAGRFEALLLLGGVNGRLAAFELFEDAGARASFGETAGA
jgi:hypothetical protein